MLISVQLEIGMDFVGDDLHTVAQADFAHSAQLFWRPCATHRIMRVAHNQEFGLSGGGSLQSIPIKLVIAILCLQGDSKRLAVPCNYGLLKFGVHRRQDNRAECRNDAQRKCGKAAVKLVMVVFLLPAANRLVIPRRTGCIAEGAQLISLRDGIHNRLCSAQIHIRDPHGNHVAPAKLCRRLVVFCAVIQRSVNRLVEIVLHDPFPHFI